MILFIICMNLTFTIKCIQEEISSCDEFMERISCFFFTII